MSTRAGYIRRPDHHTGSQSSISDPRSGKSTNIIIMAAHAVDHLRHLQDFLPGFTYSAEERRTKFFPSRIFPRPFREGACT